MSKQNLLCGDKIQGLDFCEHCVLRKAKKVKFSQQKQTTTKPLEYVHLDLWGPSKIETCGGWKYFMSIIYDYSRRAWIFILKSKDEAVIKFKEWLLMVENSYDRKVKHLRADDGLEHFSESFN